MLQSSCICITLDRLAADHELLWGFEWDHVRWCQSNVILSWSKAQGWSIKSMWWFMTSFPRERPLEFPFGRVYVHFMGHLIALRYTHLLWCPCTSAARWLRSRQDGRWSGEAVLKWGVKAEWGAWCDELSSAYLWQMASRSLVHVLRRPRPRVFFPSLSFPAILPGHCTVWKSRAKISFQLDFVKFVINFDRRLFF